MHRRSRPALAAALAVLAALTVAPLAPAQDGDEPPPGPPPAGTEAPPPGGGDAKPPGAPPAGGDAKPPERELDTTSPQALALKELLHVDPRYGKDGTVELVYTFDEEAQLQDWQNLGFDRVDCRGDVTLGVGSQGQGLIQHCLELKGDFEVQYRCRIDWMSSRSDLVFFVGKGGARYGNAFVQKQSNGFRGVGRGEPDRARWGGGREVTVKHVLRGQELTAYLNGVNVGATKRLDGKLDGKVSIFMTDMRLVLMQVEIRGHVDTSKL